jgi:hypothetical protein
MPLTVSLARSTRVTPKHGRFRRGLGNFLPTPSPRARLARRGGTKVMSMTFATARSAHRLEQLRWQLRRWASVKPGQRKVCHRVLSRAGGNGQSGQADRRSPALCRWAVRRIADSDRFAGTALLEMYDRCSIVRAALLRSSATGSRRRCRFFRNPCGSQRHGEVPMCARPSAEGDGEGRVMQACRRRC